MKETNFYIASRLSKIRPATEELNRIESHLSRLKENLCLQDDFFNYCKSWKLAPWICSQLDHLKFNQFFNSDVLEKFSLIHSRIEKENEARNAAAKVFLKEFIKQGIPVAILKGNLLLHTVYHDTGYKKMNDFDMLIQPEHWPAVQQIYIQLGYIPLGFGWGGEKGKAVKFSHAGLSYISPDYKCITGTQWGLKSPTSAYKIDVTDLWKSATIFDFHGIPIQQLSPEFNLLHLILHMGIYKCGIRDCMDLYNLLLSIDNFNYDSFIRHCRKAKAIDKAIFTLKLANLCCNSIDPRLLEMLMPVKSIYIKNRLNARVELSSKYGDMQLSYNDYFHDVEMTVFYFSLFPDFHKKAKFFLHLTRQLLWPEKAICYKLSDLGPSPSWFQVLKARAKAPWLTLRLIGEEIGVHITLLLIVKLFIDTILSLKNYLIRKKSYFEYLSEKGINPSEIQQVVKGIQ